MDPWIVSRHERTRFETHFQSMKPVNGIVTGDQVKGFLMQSGLPVATLGQIWSLADTDQDGKMNINEFVIACKLISNKLRGFDIPPTLPVNLMQSLAGKGSCPTSPLLTGPSVPQLPMMRPAAVPTTLAGVRPVQPMMPTGGVLPTQPMGAMPAPAIPGQPLIPTSGSIPVQPLIPTAAGTVPLQQGMPPVIPPLPAQLTGGGTSAAIVSPSTAAPLISGITSPPSSTLQGGITSPPNIQGVPPPAVPVVPAAITKLTPPDKPPAPVESPLGGPPLEWAVPHQSKLKYTQLFNTTDRTRSGFLSGPQARNIMVATGLSQPILAQIWNLADMDSDGQLSCDEFVLALHLCDLAKSGDKIPVPLPLDMIPPAFRRQRQNSLTLAANAAGSGSESPLDPLAGIGQTTFEDKRKENYEKGQAELERRRKALLEIQKKEREERERKEREEADKREKQRLEQEAKRQTELEAQLQKQREIEQAKEEERKRAQEQREAARREMERQRQLEWEKQRIQELTLQRQKEQENVLKLKAKNQSLSIELSTLNERVKELSSKITDTRVGVTGVKSTIDGMRATRDTSMAEMHELKAKLKEQNQRLITLNHEKAKLEARTKVNPGAHTEEQEQTNLLISKKQAALQTLREQIQDLETQLNAKEKDLESNNTTLDEMKSTLSTMITESEKLYAVYAEKRNLILDMKGSARAVANSWGDNAWSNETPPNSANDVTVSEYRRYRAIYEFVSRNGDELSFQPGDIIMVPVKQNAEPGWLAGELRGQTGWFPESYVEPCDESGEPTPGAEPLADKHHLELIAEVPETSSDSGGGGVGAAAGIVDDGPGIPAGIPSPIMGLGTVVTHKAVALHTFSAKKGSQISFKKGDIITVSETQEFWWYGEIGGAEGWFPKTYVKIQVDIPSATVIPSTTVSSTVPTTVPTTELTEGEYYIAAYPYESGEPGDLTFNQDEVVYVTKKDGDWWTGTIGDRTGLFPSNYVVSYDAQAATPAPAAVEPTSTPTPSSVADTPKSEITRTSSVSGGSRSATPDFSTFTPAQLEESRQAYETEMEKAGTPKGKKPEIATVVAPYTATSAEQLSLSRGHLIMIRKKTTTGWWEGELQAKGKKRQVGWFPASYVKVMGGGGSGSKSASPKPTDQPQSQERVVALYDYQALNEDELSFVKDDVITIIAKDEADWWKGQLKGQVGLFPSNYTSPACEDIYEEIPPISSEDKKRQQCIAELIDTEQAYIEDMSIVHEVFEKPLRESKILTKEEQGQIFVNWKEIIQCNHMFLRALRVRRDMSCQGDIRMIGDILCEHLPRMTAYVRFCSCQLSAAALLQKLTDESAGFKTISKKCQSDPRTKGMPLSSFLIKPMQRITKYPLLIQKILEHTPESHADRPYLEEALAKAEEFCTQVNEGVREKQNSDRLEWLQTHILQDNQDVTLPESIVFNSLTNSIGPRKFLHHGSLSKTKSGKELTAFLLNDMLLLTIAVGGGGPLSRTGGNVVDFDTPSKAMLKLYKPPLLLNEINVLTTVGDESSTEIKLEHNKSTIISLSTSNPNERNLWIKKLSQAQKQVLAGEKSRIQKQLYRQSNFGAVGRLLVVVAEGYKLKPPTHKRQVFCQVTMGSQEHTTSNININTLEPKWNSSMQFLIKDVREDVLCLTVFDKGHYSPDEFLGRTEMRIVDIYNSKGNQHGPITKMLKLYQVTTGEILLKLDLHLFNK
uniref:Intersectin-2 n=2 Tax=Cacopsylla melanoneura TaxID=428564 RepID=A0A8D9BKH2_9HEMI